MTRNPEQALAERATKRPLLRRIQGFIGKPFSHKTVVLAMYWRRILSGSPVLLRLPFGVWWIARDSGLDLTLLGGSFEGSEVCFVERFLQAGMTVLDVGAHHGLYTLLASKRVGRAGKVIAFEPSPRERRRLSRHIRLNLCRNVHVEPFALGAGRSQSQFFLVEGHEDWCNSLRPPAVTARTQEVEVQVLTLDEYLLQNGIGTVDFLKIDVEGGERDVLRGAAGLMARAPRPVILIEVSDVRTAPWGYRAVEIVQYLRDLGYRWFTVSVRGLLEDAGSNREEYDANFVAVPTERITEVAGMLDPR